MTTSYIGPVPTAPTNVYNSPGIVATSGQTSFPTRGYSPGFEIVWLNGTRLNQTEYTATNGSDIVLDDAAAAGDILHIFTINPVDAKLYNALGANIDFNGFALGTGDTRLDETNGLTFDDGSNWLGHYEENVWTPATPNGSWTINNADFIRVGKLVTCSCQLAATADITAADFTGLPFTADTSKDGGGVVTFQNQEPSEVWTVLVQGASNVWNFRLGGTQKGLSNGKTAYCTFTYFAA